MELNYNNYIHIDDEELRQEDEKNRKEIQALLINELDNIEIEEDDDDVDDNDDDEEEEDDDDDDNNNNYNGNREKDTFNKSKDVFIQQTKNQDSRFEIESLANNKENNFSQPFNVLNNFVSNWPIGPYRQYYNVILPNSDHNLQYKFMQTNNNYNDGINDSSINWEISLHDEMGVPLQSKSGQIVSSIPDPINSNKSHKLVPTEEKCTSHHKNVITRDIGIECIPATQRELDNLELLYSARGKRIEQLQVDLDTDREKRIKDNRILNHKITLLEAELKNGSNLLRKTNEELELEKRTSAEHETVINTQNIQIMKLESNIDALKENVESCNIVIGGLNEQLSDLTSKTALSRTNQKNADLLDCINRQFDTDSYRLKTEIQRITERVDEKMKEISKLEALLDEQEENHRIQKHDWKCEKDRILDELEKEKTLCNELVNSTSQEKLEHLNSNIRDLQLGKSLAEDMNEYLQELMVELSHQVATYEASFNLLSKNDLMINNLDSEDSGNELQMDFRASCPELSSSNISPKTESQKNLSEKTSDLQKQIFLLMSRSKSLADRLLEVRKANLDSKGSMKKLQKLLDEKINSNELLQKKLTELEGRLYSIQNGEETVLESQLKISLESMEIVKNSLEQQCKGLQNQLKQATDSMRESESSYARLEEEFSSYKELAEKDKINCIEEMKIVCNNHYENLRKQLEQSWKSEKELLLDKEKNHRDKLIQDLSDAVKEVDRVKNLYIQLSQQKSNEETDRSNWQEWMVKKLEEQKRSLNQQFKKDQEAIVCELEIKHQLEIGQLESQIKAKLGRDNEDKCEGTVLPMMIDVMCFPDHLETVDRQIQVESVEDDRNVIAELRLFNDKLLFSLNSYQEECSNLKKELDSVYNVKENLEKENQLLSSQINIKEYSTSIPLASEISNKPNSIEDRLENIQTVPSIIRSTTPQLILASKRKHELPTSMQSPLSKINSQFKALREDLIMKLSEVSQSKPLSEKTSFPYQYTEEKCFFGTLSNEISMENLKEKFYDFILEVQIRAAKTLQEELLKSQHFVKQSLLEQLKPVISVLLSVDGQVLGIPSNKIKTLVNKVMLMIDHIQSNQLSNDSVQGQYLDIQPSHKIPFTLTSTPRNPRFKSKTCQESPKNIVPTSVSTSIDSWSSSINSNITQELTLEQRQIIDDECKSLKNEISQLSEALNQSDNCNKDMSNCGFSFDNINSKFSRYSSDFS